MCLAWIYDQPGLFEPLRLLNPNLPSFLLGIMTATRLFQSTQTARIINLEIARVHRLLEEPILQESLLALYSDWVSKHRKELKKSSEKSV